ncbi:MAG: hypothetical protein AAB338_00770 [Patescibacteria group bacterium]
MEDKSRRVVQKLIQAIKERNKSGKNYSLVNKEDLLPVLIKHLKLSDADLKREYNVNSSRDYNLKEMDSYKEGILDTAGIPKNYRDIYHTLLYDFCDDKISVEEVLNKLLNFGK